MVATYLGIPRDGAVEVEVEVIDVRGRRIRTILILEQRTGEHEISWSPARRGAFLRIAFAGETLTRKIIALLRRCKSDHLEGLQVPVSPEVQLASRASEHVSSREQLPNSGMNYGPRL